MRVFRTLVAAWVAGPLMVTFAPAQTGADIGCESPEWARQVQPLMLATSACGTDANCLERVEERWREVFGKLPRDMRTYWSYASAWSRIDAAKVERDFKARMEANPKDPFFVTVYGHSLQARREEQILTYQKALELDSKYGWPHYYLAALFTGRQGPQSRDLERAKPHVRGWLEACPGEAEGLGMAALVGDQSFAAGVLAASRRAVESAGRDSALRRYESLWAAEFKAVPTSEHAALRVRVRADLARIKAMERPDSIRTWQVLEKGYELTGDKAEREAVQKEMIARFPCDFATLRVRIQAWEKDHPRLEFDAEDKLRREHDALRYKLDTELARACPANSMVAESRARTARSLPDLKAEEVEEVIDDYLAARASTTVSLGLLVSYGSAPPAVELGVNRRVRLDKVADLIRAWREKPKPPALAPDAPQSRRDMHETMLRQNEWEALWYQARASNLLGRTAERDEALAKLEKVLEHAGTERYRTEPQLAWLRAEIAEVEKKPADALVFYLQAVSGLRSDENLLRSTREALKRLGASDQALASLVPPKRVRPPVVSRPRPWTDIERQLPGASLEVAGGGRFMLADDVKGKRTLVNVWATWCGPCVKELPELQKLHERIKGRSDVAIVAFNVDDNPGLVEPFLKENKYTFPVVYASAFWESLKLDDRGIPTNWIVDDKGVARAELRGFGSSTGDAWVEGALLKLEGKPDPESALRLRAK